MIKCSCNFTSFVMNVAIRLKSKILNGRYGFNKIKNHAARCNVMTLRLNIAKTQ